MSALITTPALSGRRVARRREPVPHGYGFLVCQTVKPVLLAWHSRCSAGGQRGHEAGLSSPWPGDESPASCHHRSLPDPRVVLWTWSMNSALLLVLRICSMSSSSACCGSSACSTRRSCQMILSSSGGSRISSLRVLDAPTSTAGKSRFSASSRRSRSSMLPVPLNSSKITSSIREPVSTRAAARMVSEPPFSMLRAAPKNRLGGYSAVEEAAGGGRRVVVGPPQPGDVVEQDDHIVAHLHQPLRALDGQLGHGGVVVGRVVERGGG